MKLFYINMYCVETIAERFLGISIHLCSGNYSYIFLSYILSIPIETH